MSQNIHQVFLANPITTNQNLDLMYFGRSPYGAGDDTAMTFQNFAAQFLTPGTGVSSITGTANQVLANGTTGVAEVGAVTLTLPQNIATASNPQFASLFLGSPTGPVGTQTAYAQAIGLSGNQGSFLAASYINTAGSAPTSWFYKSRSTTVGAHVAVQAADEIGRILGFGDDGTGFSDAAGITIGVDAAVSTGIVPGFIRFDTANTSGALTTAMSINSSQVVTLTHPLLPANGGTGVNNGSNTLTLAGNLATSGAFASTFTMTGATSVTFPTSGTLATAAQVAGAVQLVPSGNQTITVHDLTLGTGELHIGTSAGGGSQVIDIFSPTASKGLIQILSNDNAGNFLGRIQNASLTAARTWTFPDATGNVTLSQALTLWTPVFTFSTPGDLSVVYTLQSGLYSVVGSLVTISFNISLTPTFTTASGTMRITGLPFTSNATVGNYATGGVILSSIALAVGKTMAALEVDPGVNYLTVYTSGTATATAQLQTTQFTTGVAVIIAGSLTYMV